MLKRKIEVKIKNWIANGKNALLVTGARQVGKTYTINKVLEESDYEVLRINFVEKPDLIKLFDNIVSKNSLELVQIFSYIAQKELPKGKTIIFIDEVQECKELVSAIKFLVEEGSYKYILSGSLLGVELTNLRSAPVGYLDTINMYPLDLEEFFINNNVLPSLIDSLRECFEKRIKVDDFVHEKMIDLFYKYLVIGGMPAAVAEYIQNKDLYNVSLIHANIVENYKLDFSKYENDKSKKLNLYSVYNLIPAQIDQNNKRYTFATIEPNARFSKYENSLDWLINAGVALPVFKVSEAKLPLLIKKNKTFLKFFLSDVGLLSSIYGSATIMKLLSKEKTINYGAAFENFVAQELISKGYKLYYYNKRGVGEVDFVIEYNGKVLPVEVKSGKDYERHTALNNLLKSNSDIDKAFVLSNYNVSVQENKIYLPIYMTMFIREPSLKNIKIEDFDYSKLSNK